MEMTGLLPLPSLSLAAFLSLGVAMIVGIWRIRWALGLAVPALLCAWFSGNLRWPGLLWLAVGVGLAWARNRGPQAWRGLAMAALAAFVIALGLHLVPGLHSQKVFGGVLSTGSLPYTLRWNLDKACGGLLLLACAPSPLADGLHGFSAKRRCKLLVAGVGCLVLTVLVAALSGRYSLDPKLPMVAPAWLLANLCFVVIPEEAFFRMTLQPAMELATGSPWLALVIASLGFGFAHAMGGWLFVLLASLAGLGYGMAYMARRAPWHPVAFHVGLNTLHFFLFAYPMKW